MTASYYKLIVLIIFCLELSLASLTSSAQDTINPSLKSHTDTLTIVSNETSRDTIINSPILMENKELKRQLDSVKSELVRLKKLEQEMVALNDALNQKNIELSKELLSKSQYLEEQLRVQREKEVLFNEKENLYKEAMNSTILDKVKLEGQLASRDSKLDGKEREIALLQQNIDDKSKDILARNSEIQKIVNAKENSDKRIDSLRTYLSETEKSLVKSSEQLKYTEIKLKDCENKYINVTNKKKKTRVVQGFAIKNFRTPDYILAPKDIENQNVYVISNKNSSNIEFDYVTGASFMVKDLSKPGSSLTYDVGFFLGFGGNNLFKNFYIGPNVKLFDVIHVNMGANIAEYQLLKDGFKEGDALMAGTAIPTSKAWKINGYLGFTFDLELITLIGKR